MIDCSIAICLYNDDSDRRYNDNVGDGMSRGWSVRDPAATFHRRNVNNQQSQHRCTGHVADNSAWIQLMGGLH